MTVTRIPARCPHVDPQWGQCVYAEGHGCECLPEALAHAAPAAALQELRRAVGVALQRARRWWR